MNEALGVDTYDYIDTGYIGTDAIKVAIIFNSATVTPYGSYAVLDSTVDPRFLDDKNRPALAQTFQNNQTGGLFTVAVNHLKSKGSDCNDVGDPDLGDGAGNCNITRTLAAQALVDWLASDPTNSGDADYLIIGDLNSYDKEDPIDAIKAGPDGMPGTADDYTDTIFQFLGEDAYSYVFDGQIGYLDHALASANLDPQITGVTIWHNNADEPDILDYDMTFKASAQDALYAPTPYRASDHDPVVIGLQIPYRFEGFFPPVENMPVVNEVKAGSTVPMKFSLTGYYGKAIFASGYPVSVRVDPDTLEPMGDSAMTKLPGKRGLSYNADTDTYNYGWQTQKSWKGTTRLFTMILDDGSVHQALFYFK